MIAWAMLTGTGALAATQPPPACDGAAPQAGEAYSHYQARTARTTCRKPWTILVYMMADGDLAPDAFWDLYEMEAGFMSGRQAGGSTARTDLLVQLAAPGIADALRFHIFQQQSELYDDRLTLEDFKKRGIADIRSPIAGQVPRTENGQPLSAATELERFLDWGIQAYPSEHTMVIIWGHGQGWASAAAFASRHFGGLAFSADSHTFLDIPSLHGVLSRVSNQLLGGHPIDVYASDACLMQMVEVATELSDASRFISGSSQVENYLGLPYRRLMFEINTGRFSGERARMGVAGTPAENDEPYLLARMLPRIFRMSLEQNGLHGRVESEAIKTVTMSSISSDELRAHLMPALHALAHALNIYLAQKPLRAIPVAQVVQQTPSFMGGARELGTFLGALKAKALTESPDATELTSAIDLASQALERTVISYALGTSYAAREDELFLQGFRALAIWLPSSHQDYASRIGDFSSSLFYQELGGEWSAWLATLFGN